MRKGLDARFGPYWLLLTEFILNSIEGHGILVSESVRFAVDNLMNMPPPEPVRATLLVTCTVQRAQLARNSVDEPVNSIPPPELAAELFEMMHSSRLVWALMLVKPPPLWAAMLPRNDVLPNFGRDAWMSAPPPPILGCLATFSMIVHSVKVGLE